MSRLALSAFSRSGGTLVLAAFLLGTVARPGAAGEGSPLAEFDIRDALGAPPFVVDRTAAIARLRSELPRGAAANLQVRLNPLGLPQHAFNDGGTLTDRAPLQDRRELARAFLSDHADLFGLSEAEIRDLATERHYSDPDGTEYLRLQQAVAGIPVFRGLVQFAFDSEGRMLQAGVADALPGLVVDTWPVLSDQEAVRAAYLLIARRKRELGITPPATPIPAGVLELLETRTEPGGRSVFRNPGGAGLEDVLSELRVFPVAGEPSRLAYLIYLHLNGLEWYEVMVDAHSGELLRLYNLFQNTAQGTVWTRSPSFGARTVESFVGDTTINPSGWMSTNTVSTGNNVDAYLDTDANNVPDPDNSSGLSGGRAFSSTQDFTFPFGDGTTGQDPRLFKAASVADLFYFNNVIHDWSYSLGFTEAAGNFQTDNFGRGGIANDPVNAESQDGSGLNNANFATPPDGFRPRMQMFLWNSGTPTLTDDLDGDYDGDIVFHEYGHGISNRLVGGPQNVSCLGGIQAGAMGEGWSDYWAISRYQDPIVGEYSVQDFTAGIRRYAYGDGYPWGYASVGVPFFQVHNDGEIWAATLWDMNQTLGAATADALVIAGMKLTVCSPSMINARDGILQADQNMNGGANQSALWHVFARHGMGNGASGNNGTTHIPAYALPPAQGSSFSSGGGEGGVPIPDNNTTGASSTIVVGSMTIGRLSVIPLVTHTAIGDLVIDLISPGNITVNLWNRSSGNPADLNNNITRGFQVAAFNGQNAQGTWTVRVKDLAVGNTGSFQWRLDITPGAGAPDFSISAAPNSVTVAQGGSGSTTVTVTSLNGFNSATTLSVSALPSGVTAAFSTNPVTPPPNGNATSALTFTASSTAATGTFPLTVTGTSGALSRGTAVTLAVTGAGPVTVFYDGAEAVATTLTFSSTTESTLWKRFMAAPFAGSWRWHAGSPTGGAYGNNADARMTTPTLDLTGASSATLTYAFRHSTEAGFDFFAVRISTDGGATFTNLARVSGQSAGWQGYAPLASINLNAYVGQSNVKIQFQLTSNASVTGPGADVDEIKVVKQ